MPLPKPKKTKRKFYNKHIYKISCKLNGAYALRAWGIDHALDVAQGGMPAEAKWNYWSEKNTAEFMRSAKDWIRLGLVLTNNEDKVQLRVEGNNIDVYTSDRSIYDAIGNEFADSDVVWRRFEPKAGTEQELLNSKNSIFVKKLPHERYLYKVYLLPHKLGSRADRIKLCDWLETQVPSISFSTSVRKWLIETRQNWDRRYIYVQDDQMLMMLSLRENAMIGRTYKHIIK
jgi:hypothetical protein|tara:strand:+ start:3769 stop:4458 length:690 start_codon:yes stop_codon:yes gene_type:complete